MAQEATQRGRSAVWARRWRRGRRRRSNSSEDATTWKMQNQRYAWQKCQPEERKVLGKCISYAKWNIYENCKRRRERGKERESGDRLLSSIVHLDLCIHMQTKHWERRGELRVYLSKSRVEEEKKTILFMAQKHKRSPRQATKLPTLDSSSGSVSSCPLRQLQQLANSCQYLKYAKAAISRERGRARRAEEAGKGSRAWS